MIFQSGVCRRGCDSLKNHQIWQKFGQKMKKILVQLAFNPFLHVISTMETRNPYFRNPFHHQLMYEIRGKIQKCIDTNKDVQSVKWDSSDDECYCFNLLSRLKVHPHISLLDIYTMIGSPYQILTCPQSLAATQHQPAMSFQIFKTWIFLVGARIFLLFNQNFPYFSTFFLKHYAALCNKSF